MGKAVSSFVHIISLLISPATRSSGRFWVDSRELAVSMLLLASSRWFQLGQHKLLKLVDWLPPTIHQKCKGLLVQVWEIFHCIRTLHLQKTSRCSHGFASVWNTFWWQERKDVSEVALSVYQETLEVRFWFVSYFSLGNPPLDTIFFCRSTLVLNRISLWRYLSSHIHLFCNCHNKYKGWRQLFLLSFGRVCWGVFAIYLPFVCSLCGKYFIPFPELSVLCC